MNEVGPHHEDFHASKLQLTALIVIDASQRRQDEEAKYRARQHALTVSKTKLHEFETIDVPEFQRWFEQELAGPLGTMRILQRELDQLEHQLAAIETYAAYAGVSLKSASRKIQTATAADELDELWAHTLGEAPECESECESESPNRIDPKPQESHIREVYKRLVRLLHPDLNPKASQLNLWHEVQSAYLACDALALDSLLESVLKAAKVAPDLSVLPIGDVIAMRRNIEAKLRLTRRQLRSAKDHPAWNFRRLKKNAVRRRALRCSLSAAISMDVEAMQAKARALRLALRRLSR